eukprot:SAG31_NODE_6031_length_2202_cov_3.104186_2_plen_237_part_00
MLPARGCPRRAAVAACCGSVARWRCGRQRASMFAACSEPNCGAGCRVPFSRCNSCRGPPDAANDAEAAAEYLLMVAVRRSRTGARASRTLTLATLLPPQRDCGDVALGGYAGAFDPLGCVHFRGDPAESAGCQHCKRPAILHELQISVKEGSGCLLGRTARLLLNARVALTELRSIAWCVPSRAVGVCSRRAQPACDAGAMLCSVVQHSAGRQRLRCDRPNGRKSGASMLGAQTTR